MLDTAPVFFVSSGRSGTQMLEKVFSVRSEIEIHHEFMCTYVQPLAARWYMGRIGRTEAVAALRAVYEPAVYYSLNPIWADSSNKLSWVIELLEEIFPTARYVYTVRDGRKVASSFFHKLGNECYDDRSVAILRGHLEDPERNPCPPPEKKYWWNVPLAPSPWAQDFAQYEQFERICFHWGEVNRVILRQLVNVPESRRFFCRLEDLVTDEENIKSLCRFLGLSYAPEIFRALGRPQNVNRPEDRLLTPAQLSQLFRIAGDMMTHFGYDQREEYQMAYGQPDSPCG